MGQNKLLIETYFPNDEMTRYGFISHMEHYIKQLLTDPTKAKVDEYLEKHGVDSPRALSLLLKRLDPSDENSSVLLRTEKIKTNDETGKDVFHIKYKLPRKDYMKKMRNLYINTFESHIIDGSPLNEMNANELDSSVTKKTLDGGKIKYSFGKNGWGLSDELVKVGKDIKKMSKENNVYIDDVFIDSLDDVYDITVTTKPLTEGAWGEGILDNDSALDYQDKFGETTLKTLVNDIQATQSSFDKWAKVGVLIDFIKKYKDDEILLTDYFNYAIDFAKEVLRALYHDNNFINSWSKPNEIKSSLKKVFNEIAGIKYDKEIMNIEEPMQQQLQVGPNPIEPNTKLLVQQESVIKEEGEGATNASSSGQFVQPLFGTGEKKKMKGPITRTIFLTQGQVDKLKEAVEMDTRFGDFGYDAPPFSNKKDPAYDHKDMIKKSIKK